MGMLKVAVSDSGGQDIGEHRVRENTGVNRLFIFKFFCIEIKGNVMVVEKIVTNLSADITS